MEALAPDTLALLAAVGVLAGLVDAIAGGGGLLALPALLWAGLPPLQALATNKLQGSFGTATASFNYIRRGEIEPRGLLGAVAWTFLGATTGTLAVQYLVADWLDRLVPVLLIGFALYFLFSSRIGEEDARRPLSACW